MLESTHSDRAKGQLVRCSLKRASVGSFLPFVRCPPPQRLAPSNPIPRHVSGTKSVATKLQAPYMMILKAGHRPKGLYGVEGALLSFEVKVVAPPFFTTRKPEGKQKGNHQLWVPYFNQPHFAFWLCAKFRISPRLRQAMVPKTQPKLRAVCGPRRFCFLSIINQSVLMT